jgi:hypothetical protein
MRPVISKILGEFEQINIIKQLKVILEGKERQENSYYKNISL